MSKPRLRIELPPLVLQMPLDAGWSAQGLAQLKARLPQLIEQEVRQAMNAVPTGTFGAAEAERVGAAIERACQAACAQIQGACP